MSGIVGDNTGRGSGTIKSSGVGADDITGAEIADDSIDSEHYVDGSIDNAHINDLDASKLTGTIADARFPATLPAASGVNLTALNATNIGSGTVPTARLGTGTASSSTFLRGDQTYAEAGGGKVLQVVNVVYTTESTTTNTFPLDTSIPQNTEGAELTTASITCSATSSKVLFFCSGELSSSAAGGALMVALFKNSDANALHVQTGFRDDASYCSNYAFQYEDSPSSVSEQTYKIRYGSNTGTSYVNRESDASGRWGGLRAWRITLMEISA